MDRRLALPQRVHAAARAHGQDLRDDGQRDLLRPVGPDVEAHGAVDPRCVALAERPPPRAQSLEHPLGALARSQHPDVGDRSPDEGPQVALVVREVVGHDDGVAAGVERQALEQLLGATLDQRRRRRKTLRREVGGAPVHDHDAEPDVRREARQGPGVVTGAADHQLGRREEHVEEQAPTSDLVQPGLFVPEQRLSLLSYDRVQFRRSQASVGGIGCRYEPHPASRIPNPDDRCDDKRFPTLEQLPFPRSLFEHRLDENVHLTLASDAQVPGRDLVAARAVALELGRPRPEHLERHLAHVLLEAPAAHVADRAPILGDEQLRTLVAVGRAAHAYHGRERSTPARPVELREAIEDDPGFLPVLHAKEIYLGCWWERCATRSANCCQKVSVSFLAVPVSSRAPTLATVPRTSDVALHLRRQRFGATGSISRSVLTSTADPGALPRAASLSRCGGRTSVRSTSSWNLSFTLPTPNADTTLKGRSSTARTDSPPRATGAPDSRSSRPRHTC